VQDAFGSKGIPKFLNLWELMNNYNVWQLAVVIGFLSETESIGELRKNAPAGDTPVPRDRIEQYYRPMVEYTKVQCQIVELSAALHRCDIFSIALRDGLLWSELAHQARALTEAIEGEIKFRRFAYVPTEKANLHDKYRTTWATVLSKFPETDSDISDAIDAYALGLGTSCVFHLMRIAEKGLRRLATKVGVRLTHKGKPIPLQFGDWDKVITAVGNKITAARAKPHGAKRQAQLQFYSDAADHCLYMKDIWRNEVSHTRRSYNDAEALGVINRVRDFMELLVKNL
jgi:hypothetical protein